MLLSGHEKMSKSLGNFYTIREVLERAPAEAARMLLLRAQYRSTLEFSFEALRETQGDLDRFYRAVGDAEAGDVPGAVMAALCDDLNTPAAFAAMHELAGRALAGDRAAASGLKAAGGLLGLLQSGDWFTRGVDAAAVEAAVAERIARRGKGGISRGRMPSGRSGWRGEWRSRTRRVGSPSGGGCDRTRWGRGSRPPARQPGRDPGAAAAGG